MIKNFSILSLLVLCGCSTVLEGLTDSYDTPSYERTKDEKGRTKYVRKRIISPHERHDFFDAPPHSHSENCEHRRKPALSDIATTVASVSAMAQDNSNFQDEPVAAVHTSISKSYTIDGALNLTVLADGRDTAQMELSYNWIDKYIDFGVGLSYLKSDFGYFGFSGAAMVHFDWKFSPFVSLGLYGGDSRTCNTQSIDYGYEEETCEKYLLFSATADAGFQARLDENFMLRTFARRFSHARQDDPLSDTLYGMSFMVLF